MQNKLAEALQFYKRALPLFEHANTPAHLATTLDMLSLIAATQKKDTEAFSYSERALVLRMQVGNSADTATTLTNMSRICLDQGKLEEACHYGEQALALREQVAHPAELAIYLHNIATIYQRQAKWHDALVRLLSLISLYEEQLEGHETERFEAMEAVAVCYEGQGQQWMANISRNTAQNLLQMMQKKD